MGAMNHMAKWNQQQDGPDCSVMSKFYADHAVPTVEAFRRTGACSSEVVFVDREHIEELGEYGSASWLEFLAWVDTHVADGQMTRAFKVVKRTPDCDIHGTQKMMVSTLMEYLMTFKRNWACRSPAQRQDSVVYKYFPVLETPAMIAWAVARNAEVAKFAATIPELFASAEHKLMRGQVAHWGKAAVAAAGVMLFSLDGCVHTHQTL
jgi:hypothetical protein